jgi:hypothetical protein
LVKSAGYFDQIPTYIQATQVEQLRLFSMAIASYDFTPLNSNLTFEHDEQYIIKFNLTLMPKFKADYDTEQEVVDPSGVSFVKKTLFLYLDDPNNGLRLVEPSVSILFSPFAKIEIRKFPFRESEAAKDSLQVAFARRSLNQTIFIQNNSTITHFVFYLNANRSITNPMVSCFFIKLNSFPAQLYLAKPLQYSVYK